MVGWVQLKRAGSRAPWGRRGPRAAWRRGGAVLEVDAVADAQEALGGHGGRVAVACSAVGWRSYRLAVAPTERGRGVARALVAAAERQLQAKGARRVTALVRHDDTVANCFWEEVGYPTDIEMGRRVRNL